MNINTKTIEVTVSKTVQDLAYEPFTFSFKQVVDVEGLQTEEATLGLIAHVEGRLEELADKVLLERIAKTQAWIKEGSQAEDQFVSKKIHKEAV